MYKSIRNVGVFEGGKATMHAGALTPVLLWPERTPLKHTVAGRKAAVRLSKAVTRVVTDWIYGWKPKYTGVSETNFIGELNRRSTKTLPFKNPAAAINGDHTRKPNRDYKKGTLLPPYPRVRSMGTTQKFFSVFRKGVSR